MNSILQIKFFFLSYNYEDKCSKAHLSAFVYSLLQKHADTHYDYTNKLVLHDYDEKASSQI